MVLDARSQTARIHERTNPLHKQIRPMHVTIGGVQADTFVKLTLQPSKRLAPIADAPIADVMSYGVLFALL